MTMILPCDPFQRKPGNKEGGIKMEIGLSGSMKLRCLFVFESQTKGKREGRTRKMYWILIPSAKEKGSLWIRET